MAPNPEDFVAHLRAEGYHSRSNKHSNSLSECIVRDLVSFCPAIRNAARNGKIVYDLNFTILTGTAEWNVDLVFGEPPPGMSQSHADIRRTRPSTVQVAIEIKSVMTEHRKAIKNRKRDFEAHHDHVHRYNPRAIAGGVLVVNMAATFQSPLRLERTAHKTPAKLAEHCVDEMRAVAVRASREGTGLDAKAVLVLDTDNVDNRAARYVTTRPAPQVGDPMHYDAFIQTICAQYADRFAR